MMNYSYLNNKDNSGRYAVNHLTEGNKEEDMINKFRDFRKFKIYNSMYQNQYAKKFSSEKQERQPTEDDQCYNCGIKGHFSRSCPQRNIPEDKKENKVEGKSSTDYDDHDNHSELNSEPEENLEIFYVNRRKDGKNLPFNKEGCRPYKLHELYSKINELSNQFSELITEIG